MLAAHTTVLFSITIFHYAEFEGGGGDGPQVSSRTTRSENIATNKTNQEQWGTIGTYCGQTTNKLRGPSSMASSGMLRRVALVTTDVSEELSASACVGC
jgi:hypothetical protein